jgi:UDP-2,4-diacetamido-2,4,6-trideoxy-beta-L-altropyranose hydrolase
VVARVAIRVDASIEIGLGHLARCLSLAKALRQCGAEVAFVCRDLGLDDAARIAKDGFECRRLPPPGVDSHAEAARVHPRHAAWAGVPWRQDAEETVDALAAGRPDWIVVDHYSFDARWHQCVASVGARLCVIDDLGDRHLQADLLVDHNLADNHAGKYAETRIGRARILGGPRYALIAASYATAPRHEVRDQVASIGIFMGGTDPRRLSELALRACRDIAGFSREVEVATTSANPALDALGAACRRYGPSALLVDAPDLSSFFGRHDLQVGAGGGALWERCCIGAPTIAIAFADNQRPSLAALEAVGAVKAVSPIDLDSLGKAVHRLIDDPAARRRLSERARTLVDGRGAERVALAMVADSLTLSPAVAADADLAYGWRNDERTRRHFRDPAPIAVDAHRQWWSRAISSANRNLLIARCGSVPVGFVRLDNDGKPAAEVSYYLDPELTSLGLGSAALRAAQRWICTHGGNARIVAHVFPENTASARAFAAAGFARVGDMNWQWEARQ